MKKDVLESSADFREKCCRLLVDSSIKKDAPTQKFSYEFCKFFKNTFFRTPTDERSWLSPSRYFNNFQVICKAHNWFLI